MAPIPYEAQFVIAVLDIPKKIRIMENGAVTKCAVLLPVAGFRGGFLR